MKQTIAMIALSAFATTSVFAADAETRAENVNSNLKVLSQGTRVEAEGIVEYIKNNFGSAAGLRAYVSVDPNLAADIILDAATRAGIQAGSTPARFGLASGEAVASTLIIVKAGATANREAAQLSYDLAQSAGAGALLAVPSEILGTGYAEIKAGAKSSLILVVETGATTVDVVESAFVDAGGSVLDAFKTLFSAPKNAPEAFTLGIAKGAGRVVANAANGTLKIGYDFPVALAKHAAGAVVSGVTTPISNIPYVGTHFFKYVFKPVNWAAQGVDKTIQIVTENTTDKLRGLAQKGSNKLLERSQAKESRESRAKATQKVEQNISTW